MRNKGNGIITREINFAKIFNLDMLQGPSNEKGREQQVTWY
jgi:hypothetical protein